MDKVLLHEIKQELERIKQSNTLMIVEGSKDKKALEELGAFNVIVLKGKPLFKLVEDIKEKEIVILTDLDAEGKKLYHGLKHELSQRGVKINDRLRILLFRTELRQIEGLANYLMKQES